MQQYKTFAKLCENLCAPLRCSLVVLRKVTQSKTKVSQRYAKYNLKHNSSFNLYYIDLNADF